MDSWLLAAAAGAGYLATRCHKHEKDKDSSKETLPGGLDPDKSRSTPLIQPTQDKSCPSHRIEWHKRLCEEEASIKGEKFSEGCAFRAQATCDSRFDGENPFPSVNCDDSNLCSSSSLPLELPQGENCFQAINNGFRPSTSSPPKPSVARMGSIRGSSRNRSANLSMLSYTHFVRPLTSLESCLISQLYKDQIEKEEYLISSLSSPTESLYLVADGSQTISQASESSCNAWIGIDRNKHYNEACAEQNENVFGIPPLPKVMSTDLPVEIKLKTKEVLDERLSIQRKTVNGNQSHSQGDKKLLLSLGVSIGIISSAIANKGEVENLRQLLKQTENLVKDLHEEIEMKDAITVQELVNEGYDSQSMCDYSFHNMEQNTHTSAQDIKEFAKYDRKEMYERAADKNSDHMRTIEVELEAELERLELNMNASSLEKGVPDLVEFDPEFVATLVHGELRADKFASGIGNQTDPDQCTSSSTSTTHSANYAVSPRDLSLRLHEVIQSRLEERVEELEMALENSQRRVKDLESKQLYSWRNLSDGETESPPSPGANPLVLNLSEESLGGVHEFEEERVTFRPRGDTPEGDLRSLDWSFSNSWPHRTIDREVSEESSAAREWGLSGEEVETELSAVKEWGLSEEAETSSDENDDGGGDEREKLLIKQIVERTKQGSPALLKAQRAFFTMV